ncbi:MAG: hypothetical protein AAGA90_03265 [Actinomycetota bacterium]
MTSTATPDTRPALEPSTIASAERGLKVAAVMTVLTGLFFASASTGPTDVAARQLLDLIFFRLGDGPAELRDSHHLVNAVLGGVMVGWGVTVWLVADRLLALAPREVGRIVLVGLIAWFVVDSTGSIASGGWLNAVLNVGFLGVFLVPLRHLR